MNLDLPAITDAATYAEAQAGVLQAVAAGEISPAEAKAMGNLVVECWKAVRVAERYRRMAALRL